MKECNIYVNGRYTLIFLFADDIVLFVAMDLCEEVDIHLVRTVCRAEKTSVISSGLRCYFDSYK